MEYIYFFCLKFRVIFEKFEPEQKKTDDWDLKKFFEIWKFWGRTKKKQMIEIWKNFFEI